MYENGPGNHTDRALRIVATASFLAAMALVVPSSEYNPATDGVGSTSAEQAFNQINMTPDPSSGALQSGTISILEQSTASSNTITPPPESTTTIPQEVMPIPEQEPGYVDPNTETTKTIPTTSPTAKAKQTTIKTRPKNTSNPEKTKIPSVNASRPTAFIAPEILGYVAGVGEVKSDHNPDGSWTITPPEATNAELQMVWWWSEHSRIGTNMKEAAYLYAHKCHEGASIVCAGDNFDKLQINDKIKLPTEDGVIELTVIKKPITLPKTAEGIGNSGIYKYDRPGIVWLITCSYNSDGQTSVKNTAVETQVTGATNQNYVPSKD